MFRVFVSYLGVHFGELVPGNMEFKIKSPVRMTMRKIKLIEERIKNRTGLTNIVVISFHNILADSDFAADEDSSIELID